jgi:hypothetical protein
MSSFKFEAHFSAFSMGCKNCLPPAPPGWELSGAADGGKRAMRCTKRDSYGNKCIRIIRFSSTPHTHHSLFRPETITEPKQTQIER